MPLQKYNRFCLLVVEATYSSVISAPVMTTNRKLALKNALQEKWFQISKESLLLANEYGKKFFCRLPKLPSNSESEKNFKKQNLTVNLISEVASAAFYVKNCVSRVCFHLFLWNINTMNIKGVKYFYWRYFRIMAGGHMKYVLDKKSVSFMEMVRSYSQK